MNIFHNWQSDEAQADLSIWKSLLDIGEPAEYIAEEKQETIEHWRKIFTPEEFEIYMKEISK